MEPAVQVLHGPIRSSILDLGILLLLRIHTEHEWERCICIPEVSQRKIWYVQISDVLILKREYQASESLATVDKFVPVCTYEHVAGLEEDTFENSHDVVDFKPFEETCDGLVIDKWKLVKARHAEFDHFILRRVVFWVRIWQVKLKGRWELSQW